MYKVAVFVEGKTELIFVREMIFHIFGYEKVSLDCFSLGQGGNLTSVPRPHPVTNPVAYFQLVSTGGDTKVLDTIIKRTDSLKHQGFDRIIGLRDMFSESYLKFSKQRIIVESINQNFINGSESVIAKLANARNIGFYYSIMEVEAWFLGIQGLLEKIDLKLNPAFINNQLNISI